MFNTNYFTVYIVIKTKITWNDTTKSLINGIVLWENSPPDVYLKITNPSSPMTK